ncbi:tripartite motif-containing protein 45 [Exaiptasia diaphana]|uniref:Uncharacterized protein n=1 Tax=Exaiptasia diaphana TaxID=2652724 RepID=A0A913XK33_EXADI|nr:tripartite motif-containing protein 45 [Exaiptasia diaphana]KXJ20321.1 Tripartite motif-containing protein 45 [Exaiptasia diaphana]
MAAKMSLSLEDQVICPICLEQYQDPRILPCLHTYCKHCLEYLLKKGPRQFSIKCPECREVVKIDDVDTLKVNIWVNKNLTILELRKTDTKQTDSKSGIMCDNCESKLSAEARCMDCEKFCCDFCVTAHERMSILKEHQLVSLKEIKAKGIPIRNKPPLCEKHKGEVKKLFCKTCERLICRDCIIIDHKEHDFSFVDDIVEERKEEIRGVILKTNGMIEKSEVYIAEVICMRNKLKTKESDTEAKIHEFINEKIETLERRRTTLLQEAKNVTSREMKELAECEDNGTLHMASLRSAIAFAEDLVTKASNSDVMCLSKQVITRLSELNVKPLNVEAIPEPWIPVLQVNQLLDDDIATIDSTTYTVDSPSSDLVICGAFDTRL